MKGGQSCNRVRTRRPSSATWVFSQTVGGDEAAYFIKSAASGRPISPNLLRRREVLFRAFFPGPLKARQAQCEQPSASTATSRPARAVGLGGQIDAERGVFEAELSEDVLADIAAAQSAIFVAGAGARTRPWNFRRNRTGAALKALAAASE